MITHNRAIQVTTIGNWKHTSLSSVDRGFHRPVHSKLRHTISHFQNVFHITTAIMKLSISFTCAAPCGVVPPLYTVCRVCTLADSECRTSLIYRLSSHQRCTRSKRILKRAHYFPSSMANLALPMSSATTRRLVEP